MPVRAPVLVTFAATTVSPPASACAAWSSAERRVGQAVAERDRRARSSGVVPAVADEHALLVVDARRRRPGTSRGRRRSAGRPRRRGNVAGRRPPGSASPNSTRAIAAPPACARVPGLERAPATLSRHGVSTGPPVSSTTIVFGFAAATALDQRVRSPVGRRAVERQAAACRCPRSGSRRRRRRRRPSPWPAPAARRGVAAVVVA